MIDLLGFISDRLNAGQRGQQSAAELALRGQLAAQEAAQSEADRALRERLGLGELDLRKQQFNKQFEYDDSLDRQRLAQSADQFSRELALRQAAQAQSGNQFSSELELNRQRLAQSQAQSEAERKMQELQLLGNLAGRFESPDLLNLVGSRFGLPNLGYRTNFNAGGGGGASGGNPNWKQGNWAAGLHQPSLYDRSMERIRNFINHAAWPS